jgi:hypothetical protein
MLGIKLSVKTEKVKKESKLGCFAKFCCAAQRLLVTTLEF